MKTPLYLIPILLLAGCQQKPPSIEQSVEAAGAPAPAASPVAEGDNRPSAFHKSVITPAVVQIPSGSAFVVRLNQTIDTRSARPGDRFSASLDSPILVGERAILPVGTPVSGHVVAAKDSGRLRGRGSLAITLDSFQLKGKTYSISTSSDSWATSSHKKRNLGLIGGGSGVGALIGGLAGGGSGALIGAGAGAAAGTAGAAATGKKHVHLSAETRVRFTLRAPVRIQG